MIYREERGLLGGIVFPIPYLENLHIGLSVKALQRTTLDESYSAVEIVADDFENEYSDDMETDED